MNGDLIDDTNSGIPVVVVEANCDKDITTGAKVGKINESRDEMEIDIKEERKKKM